jgi:hypothetical protein
VLLVGDAGIQVWAMRRMFDDLQVEELTALANLHSGQKVLPAGVVTSAERGELKRLRQRFPSLFAAPSREQVAAWLRRQLGQVITCDQAGMHAHYCWLSRLCDLDPDESVGRAARAILLAEMALAQADALVRGGDYRRAAAEAEKLSRDKSLADDRLYDVACVLALCAASAVRDPARPLPERDRQAEVWSRQALALLERVRRAGYFKEPLNVQHLKKDRDFDFLRDRADFRKWLAGLEASLLKPRPG